MQTLEDVRLMLLCLAGLSWPFQSLLRHQDEDCFEASVRRCQLIWWWSRSAMAVAGEVTRHGQAHPYSWLVTIISLSGLEKWWNKSQKWVETKLLRHVLWYKCQHVSGTCQSHFHSVQSLHKTSRNYMEFSCSTAPFLTLRFSEKDLLPTPRLLQVRPILPPLRHILSVPSRSFGWQGSVGWSCQVYCFGKSL